MKVTKEVAPLLGAAAATLPFAYLGNRFVDCACSYSDMLEGLTAAPAEMWGFIAAHPFRLLTNDAGMLGMLLGICIPWAIAMVCLVYGQKNTRVGEEHGSRGGPPPRNSRLSSRIKIRKDLRTRCFSRRAPVALGAARASR